MSKITRTPGYPFSAKHPPEIGDKVRVGHGRMGELATVASITPEESGHAVLRFTDRIHEWWVYPDAQSSACTLVEPVKMPAKEPTAPMTQKVLELLRTKGALTSMEAQGVLRCRQLPARILELKRLGHKIVTEIKRDPTGQKYARYHLQAVA